MLGRSMSNVDDPPVKNNCGHEFVCPLLNHSVGTLPIVLSIK